MTLDAKQLESRRRAIVLTGFGVLAVVLVLFARVALDIALVLAICAGLFLIQRTAGDWLNEALGAGVGTLLFASVTATFLWFLLMTHGGQSAAEKFLAVADEHGFHTVFLQKQIIPPSNVRRLPSGDGGPNTTPQPTDAPEVSNPSPVETQGAPGAADASGTRGVGADKNKSGAQTGVDLSLSQNRAKVGQRVVATATVRAGGQPVDSGLIAFTVNGISRIVPVKDGSATIDIVEMLTGRFEVRAQFRGTSRFAPASSTAGVLIIE
jgi:Bacterial Ig-like domain (group 3)